MYLEDFRNNDLGMAALLLSTEPPLKIHLNYSNYAVFGYDFTSKCLSELENSNDGLNNSLYCFPAICMWHLSIESFIGTLLKILCLRSGMDYQQALALPLHSRYRTVLDILSIPAEKPDEKELVDKLEDFNNLHTNISLDFFDDEKLIYKKANFASFPFFLNQADVLQGMLIVLEVFEKFRFIICGVDLMPNISLLTENNHIVFDKLGTLYTNVISPSVKDILSKHGIKIKLNFTEKFTNLEVSPLFQTRQVLPIFKAQEDEEYKVDLSKSKTDIISGFHKIFLKKFTGQEHKFGRNFLSER